MSLHGLHTALERHPDEVLAVAGDGGVLDMKPLAKVIDWEVPQATVALVYRAPDGQVYARVSMDACPRELLAVARQQRWFVERCDFGALSAASAPSRTAHTLAAA